MEPSIVGQLGVECGHHRRTLAGQHRTLVRLWPGPRPRARHVRRPGARMNTAGMGPSKSNDIESRPRTTPTWRPYALRRTSMSIAPNDRWSVATIEDLVGQQDHSRARAEHRHPGSKLVAKGSNRPLASSSIDMVVDSPPGMTSPSTSANSSAWRTSTAWHRVRRALDVARERSLQRENSDLHAMQRFGLPATIFEVDLDLVHPDPGHGSAEAPADLGQDGGSRSWWWPRRWPWPAGRGPRT